MTIINFGLYHDCDIEDVPTSYLKWLAENINDDDELVEDVEEELRYRKDHE